MIISCYYFIVIYVNNCFRRQDMDKKCYWKWLIFIITAVAAVSAAVTAFLIVREKQKKDDEELEEYLDYSIQ